MTNTARQSQVDMMYAEIQRAAAEDGRGNAANRDAIVSAIRGNFDLPRKTIETALRAAGMTK